MRAAQALDAGKRLALDRAELGEVLGGDLGDAHAAAGCGSCGAGRSHRPAQEAFHVVLGDPALFAGTLDLGQVDLELAGEPAHARAGMDHARIGRGRRRSGGGGRRRGRRLRRRRGLLLRDHRGRRRDGRIRGLHP